MIEINKLVSGKEIENIFFRFKNPEPADGWVGVRSAKSFGNVCPQKDTGRTIMGNEDCLFLNVYSPILEFNSIPV